jgi:hypothetical protein
MLRRLIPLPFETPLLLVVIHTEEEFDWHRGFDGKATGVKHVRFIYRVQTVFEEYGIRPAYLVDYPIASQEEGFLPLKEYADAGRAVIGAHLHPWVSPPFSEEVSAYNSYPGNLPPALEAQKLSLLTEQITVSFGQQPAIYLAGRYRFGPNTASILEDLGFQVDISPAPPLDFGTDGGPDYSGFTSHPYWFGRARRLLGIPGTGAYVGVLQRAGHLLYTIATDPRLRMLHLPGILSRSKILERIRLSPEGYSQEELRRLTRTPLRQGYRVFVFSFHSPSVQPACTPYVRTNEDLARFLDNCRQYFEFFFDQLNGVSMTPLELKARLEDPALALRQGVIPSPAENADRQG